MARMSREQYKSHMRRRSKSIMVEYRGETRPLAEWAEMFGISYAMAYRRYRWDGWDAAKAFETPPMRSGPRDEGISRKKARHEV